MNNGTRGNDCVGTNLDERQDDCASTNERASTYLCHPRKGRARRDVRARSDSNSVLDDSAGVHNGRNADRRRRIDNRERANIDAW